MTKLKTIFITIIAMTAAIYLAGDYLEVDMDIFAGASETTLYVVQTVMVLLTLSLIYLCLRLFKFKGIQNDLYTRKSEALAFWGSIRLGLLGALLIVNTLLYYMFGNEANFGHMAVITLLVMPFVYPSASRCEAEVTPAEPENKKEEV
ncbi:MAG: hypothetical protein K6D91_07290 [Prevotella sp.]|nr:hypothetical protein [Prevotella sp.]